MDDTNLNECIGCVLKPYAQVLTYWYGLHDKFLHKHTDVEGSTGL